MRAPGLSRDAVFEHFVNHGFRQAGEQGDALAQSRRERDLAAHRPLGDGGDAPADPGDIREFVDAFLADQRRIHICDQEALPATGERLDDDIDGLTRDALSRARRAWPSGPR